MTENIKGEMRLSLSCQKCGSNELTIPDEATDDSPVTCSNCGAELARWGDVQAAMHKTAEEKFTESLKDAIGDAVKGIDGITFK
jgi:hypothetical protein